MGYNHGTTPTVIQGINNRNSTTHSQDIRTKEEKLISTTRGTSRANIMEGQERVMRRNGRENLGKNC